MNNQQETPQSLAKINKIKRIAKSKHLGRAEGSYKKDNKNPEAFRKLWDQLSNIDKPSLEMGYERFYYYVISQEVDINVRDENGNTIVLEMIEEIERRGKPPRNNSAQKILLGLECLLLLHPDITIPNNKGQTPIHLAARMKNKNFIQRFLMLLPEDRKKEVLNGEDEWGNTALHYWVRKEPNGFYARGISFIIKLLRYAGADATIKNKQGEMPQDWIEPYHQNFRALTKPLRTIVSERVCQSLGRRNASK